MVHTSSSLLRLLAVVCVVSLGLGASPKFRVRVPSELQSLVESEANVEDGQVVGRVLLYFSRSYTPGKEPMSKCDDTQRTSQVFGVDYRVQDRGEVVVDASVLGYPVKSLEDVDMNGVYYLQAKMVRYKQYNRPSGPVILPTSCVSDAGGDGAYAPPPGTLFSQVYMLRNQQLSTVDVAEDVAPTLRGAPLAVNDASFNQDRLPTLVLNKVQPSDEAVAPKCAGHGKENSKYIRTVRIKSEPLSKFWGEPIHLEACVLLPHGFDEPENSHVKYPLVVAHGHYSSEWNAGGRFSADEPAQVPASYKDVDDAYAYYLYKNWTMPDSGPFKGARMLVVTFNHPVPFFDDSYAVNSANIGPYGDAIVHELIPEVEKRYRGIGQGWARSAFGGSTGGWESLATQVLYPDQFNGAYASCPDPISFTSFAQVNIYEYSNAFFYPSVFKHTDIPAGRGEYSGQSFPIGYGKSSPYGQVSATMSEVNLREQVLGPNSRSCGQWDAWGAVFSPVGSDGYPARLYDKLTGEIDPKVAEYWKQNYDLLNIVKTNWPTLGPKLTGKLHLFVGASDAFYLNNAVMDMQDFLESADNPRFEGEIVIGQHRGRGFSHCYSGDQLDSNGKKLPNSITRNTILQRFLPQMAAHFAATAPEGADVSGWRY